MIRAVHFSRRKETKNGLKCAKTLMLISNDLGNLKIYITLIIDVCMYAYKKVA